MPENELAVSMIDPEEIDLYRDFFPDSVLEDFIGSENLLLFGIRTAAVACGGAAVEVKGLSCDLRYIAIAPAYRFFGYGTRAVGELMEIFREAGFTEMTMTYEPELCPELEAIGEKYGFEGRDTGRASFIFRLKNLTSGHQLFKIEPVHVKGFAEVSKQDKACLYDGLRDHGMALVSLPPDPDTLAEELSAVCYEDKKPAGVIFTEKAFDGEYLIPYYRISCLAYMGKKEVRVAELISYVVKKAKESLPPETQIRFVSLNPQLTAFAEQNVAMPETHEVEVRVDLNGD